MQTGVFYNYYFFSYPIVTNIISIYYMESKLQWRKVSDKFFLTFILTPCSRL